MEITFDKYKRLIQRQILQEKYLDYEAKKHDIFVTKYNKEIKKENLNNYMKNRGLL